VMNDTRSDYVEEGNRVLVYVDRKRMWVVEALRGSKLSTDRGILDLGSIIGLNYGSEVRLKLASAWILRPSLLDNLMLSFKRVTQVVYPKDLGFAILLLDVFPGARVLDAGLGSGFVTATLANLVRPNGHVYAYDVREEFARVAIENLKKVKLDQYVTVKIKDIRDGIDEKNLDAAFIDVADPWNALEEIHSALRPSAPVVFFLPTASQVDKLLKAIEEFGGFIDVRCYEILLREYEAKSGSFRPRTRMIGHTGYITYARKVLKHSHST